MNNSVNDFLEGYLFLDVSKTVLVRDVGIKHKMELFYGAHASSRLQNPSTWPTGQATLLPFSVPRREEKPTMDTNDEAGRPFDK